MWKSVRQLAKQHAVTRVTVGNWIRAGKFDEVKRTKGGHYRVWVDDVVETIGYVRVSSGKQRTSLDTQQRIILSEFPGITVVSDIGSGFNFKRRGFRSILERVLQGDAIEIVAVSGDRITRIGLPFIRWIVELHGGTVTELEEVDCTEEFDTSSFVSFVTSFIASYHGKRSNRRKKSTGVSGKKR